MRRAVLAALGVLAATSPVDAHPHVWIDARLSLAIDDGLLTRIDAVWRFDELFSEYVETQYDQDGDRRFDAAETEAIRAEAFDGVREFGFLTHLRVDGTVRPFAEYRDFAASIEDDRIVYRFSLLVPERVEPAGQRVVVGVFDETYYIDIALDEHDPVAVDLATGCTVAVREDPEHPIYFGMVIPIVVDLRCGGS
jgi:ABC-type uncharacterized transport system substrate-binding protein